MPDYVKRLRNAVAATAGGGAAATATATTATATTATATAAAGANALHLHKSLPQDGRRTTGCNANPHKDRQVSQCCTTDHLYTSPFNPIMIIGINNGNLDQPPVFCPVGRHDKQRVAIAPTFTINSSKDQA